MQFNNGKKPTVTVDKETVRADNEYNRALLDSKSEYEGSEQNMEDDEIEEMIQLPGLPENFSSFTFPAVMDEPTEMHFDADLCYWFLDEGEIRKTLFSSVEEGEIPQVSYIVEFNKEFFIAALSEHSIEGRFSSVEVALLVADYATIGREPYEEIDYFRVCLLDREANDEEVDYIADKGLYWWIKMNADFERTFEPEKGKRNGYSYDIYEFFEGYFVLDPSERAVLGKYTSYVSASIGASDLYEERLEDEYEGDDEEEYGEDEYEDKE